MIINLTTIKNDKTFLELITENPANLDQVSVESASI